MPLISIIIPAYNAEPYVNRCFDSIYVGESSCDLFEVIVVNDGSTDRTLELLHNQCGKHSNITLIDKENEGVSVARNVGISAAKGEYVLFLDIDDELVEGSIATICEFLSQHGPIDVLETRQIRNNGIKEWVVPEPRLHADKEYDGVAAFKCHYVRTNAGGGICRLAFLKENNIQFPSGIRNAEDTIFFGMVQVFAQSIMYLAIPLYRIIQHEGSASKTNVTQLAMRHVDTMNALSLIRQELHCSDDRKAIIEFVVYQLLSNTVSYFVRSQELGYRDSKIFLCIDKLLPLNVNYMTIMKRKAVLLNLSYPIFYFLKWLKYKVWRR